MTYIKIKSRLIYLLTIFGCVVFLLYGSATAQASSSIITSHYLMNGGCGDIYRNLELTKPNMAGTDVLELQERLIEIGFSVPTNGVYDKNTAKVIKKFKIINGLEPTTEVGLRTWEALGKGVPTSSSKNNKAEKPQGNVSLLIEVTERKLTVFSDNQVFESFSVAIGKDETPTPHGEFKVISKGAWGGGFGTRWNGLNVPWGIYGIHGTNKPWSIGRYASHGCIRMHNKDVETLFPWVPIGTPVKIINNNLAPSESISRTIKIKSSGQLTVFIQEALKKQGFLLGMADGRFGNATALAVKYFQAYNSLPITGEIDPATYEMLMKKEEK